jgi:FtsP/CotA-like multicopper oxidase with cupredoxin domain
MKHTLRRFLPSLVILVSAMAASRAPAEIDGITGNVFSFTAQNARVTTPDGSNLLVWGIGCPSCSSAANPAGTPAQYPAPTLILNQGDAVTITLTNHLTLSTRTPAGTPVPNVSLVFPGQDSVTASGGVPGRLTREARAGTADVVTYTFRANHPGTFQYHSGTREDLEIEMGLVGAIIVRPTGYPNRAYAHPATAFDREHLFVITEMDPSIHNMVDFGQIGAIDNTKWVSTYWFFNGRNFPDTLAEASIPWMPAQPYNCAPRMHPGESLLVRTVSVGREVHPFHNHGNHGRIIAKDGRLLESSPGAGPDLSWLEYSVHSVPAETTDSIFTWTGEGLGWDVYGHTDSSAASLQPGECVFNGAVNLASPLCDHGKRIPVNLPDNLSLQFGEFWSGSPYLGSLGSLPPGQGRNNTTGGYFFMWHSHTEKEIVNNNVFPGGMMTMCDVEAPWVPIP